MKRILMIVLLALAPSAALAVFKCQGKDGRPVYSDLPCSIDRDSVKIDGMPMDRIGAPRPRQQQHATAAMARHMEPNPGLRGPVEAEPLLALYRLWIDGEKVALATGRIALAGPVSQLQALRRQAEAVSVAACVESPKRALVALMDRSAEAHLEFMRKEALVEFTYPLIDRPKLLAGFEQELNLARCGP